MTPRVYIRKVRIEDKEELLKLTRFSREMHEPWISPPLNDASFHSYINRTETDDHEGFVLCLKESDVIIGVINVNNIVKGSFRNASLGYYVGSKYFGNGYMEEGLILVTEYAFKILSLHRLEANVQPDNQKSKDLVKRCGFRKEGMSEAFLFIDGEWKDHERWAITDPRTVLM